MATRKTEDKPTTTTAGGPPESDGPVVNPTAETKKPEEKKPVVESGTSVPGTQRGALVDPKAALKSRGLPEGVEAKIRKYL